MLWVDLQKPDEEELSWLCNAFQFHPLAMEDVRKQRQRSKVDWYDRYYFFVLHTINYHKRAGTVDSDEIDIFLGKNFLVTVHRDANHVIEQVRQRWEKASFPNEATPFLFYLVVDAIVDSYFPVLDTIGDSIDEIDAKVFTKPEQSVLKRIFTLRHTLLNIRKIIAPLRDSFNELIRSEETSQLFNIEQTTAYLNDVFDHVLRLTDFVDTYRDMLSGSLDAYQSSLANVLNENMQRLTVAATVLATNAVITGFFGMNLQGMGINSSWPYGGYVLVAFIVVITLFEIWLFRRKGWL